MKIHNHVFPAILAALVLALSVTSVLAQDKRMTVDDLAKNADAVVVGKVTAVHSEWSSDRSRIFTRVTIGVDEYLKGQENGGAITLLTPGGEIGDVGEIYSHMPTFRTDEHVLVFVEKDKQGLYRVSGGNLGKFTIEKDQATGREFVAGRTLLEQFVANVRKATRN